MQTRRRGAREHCALRAMLSGNIELQVYTLSYFIMRRHWRIVLNGRVLVTNAFVWFSAWVGSVAIALTFLTGTGRNHVSALRLRLAETWKFKSTWFRHVSVIFKLAEFRRCSFPSCFCERIYSCLLRLPKHKREMVLWTTMNLSILTSRRWTTAASGSTSPHTS